MSTIEVVDLSSDDESEEVNLKTVKLEPFLAGGTTGPKDSDKARPNKQWKSLNQYLKKQDYGENKNTNILSPGHSISSVLDQGFSPINDTSVTSTSPIYPAPICRQFWKAGNYNDGLGSKVTLKNGNGGNHLHVHPLFLHSNATSHKWAFGAMAELIDNAVDEIQNGATFVIVDKTSNPRDGSPMLLIQDDGGGMNPEAMRRCMSFGFSEKKSKYAIGRYGNGFKTSTMRLGADVVVFSRHLDDRILTQSIGLLSYSYLRQTAQDRIVVPMVSYKLDTLCGSLEKVNEMEQFMSNISLILQWSPYASEVKLFEQFEDMGSHGTKVVIFNLWFNDDGNMELDFDTDPEDIRIAGDTRKIVSYPGCKEISEQHIANQFHHSLRAYMSILYLRLPESFTMILRGRVVESHNIADDLKFPEYILYQPQSGGCLEGTVVTTIGFLKETPHVNIHGFNIYHKNRLILPFFQVVTYSTNRGRGVVGVLQADFIEPTHNKQDFERTPVFQKLEHRLKEMTREYWDYHCELIGYTLPKKAVRLNQSSQPVVGTKACSGSRSEQGFHMKRKAHYEVIDLEKSKRQGVEGVDETNVRCNNDREALAPCENQLRDEEAINLLKENKKLRAKLLEYEKEEGRLNLKVVHLRSEIEEVRREYGRLMTELQSLDTAKQEKLV